jgi:hypothetical protein
MVATPDASIPPSATSSTLTPPGGAGPAPTPKPMMKIGIVIAVGVVVVVAAVLGGLYATHSGPFQANGSSSPGGGGGSGETFSQAAALAQPSTSPVSGGPWTLVGGVGVVTSSAITVNDTTLNTSFAGGLCQPHFLSSESSVTSIPSTSTSGSSGTTNAWLIIYANATAGALEVAVFGSVVAPVLTIAVYGSCGLGASALSLGANYVNSPAAETTAYNEGGSTFVAAHPSYNVEEILVPTVTEKIDGITTTSGSTWEIAYTDCNVAADDGATLGGAAPAQFLASINATTGTFIRGIDSTTACASSGGAGGGGGGGGGGNAKNTFSNVTEAFFFSQQHTSKTSYWNNGSLVTTVTNLTAGEVTISIENNTTGVAVSTTGMTLQIVNISLAVISVYSFTTNTWNNTAISVGNALTLTVFALNSTASLKGDKFVVTAIGSAPVTGSVSAVLGKP